MKRTVNIVSIKNFSHGSNIDRTNVDSNHILLRQRKTPSLEEGRLVERWSGRGVGRQSGTVTVDIVFGIRVGVIF